MNKVKEIFKNFREATILLIVILVGIILSISSPYFFAWNNFKSILIGLSCTGILSVGLTLVMSGGEIDISLGAQLAMAGAIVGILFKNGVPVWLAIIIAIVTCALVGLINGIVVSYTKLNSMIVTLATQFVCQGIANVITTGSPQSLRSGPEYFSFIGRGQLFDGAVPFLFIEFLIIAIVVDVLMRKSKVVRKVYYVGSNQQAAIYSGINSAKVKILTFVFAGVMAAIAGVLTTARLSVASPSAGGTIVMTAIAAVVVGGTSMTGGSGTILGTVLALLLLALVDNALVLLSVNVYWQDFISGAILLTAVLIDYFSHQKK
ncbi:MAG: ABC transporter permease [Anaerolineaceae bacterium]|nr:ABC transporter permease [Anaerolineaceae bacterium]